MIINTRERLRGERAGRWTVHDCVDKSEPHFIGNNLRRKGLDWAINREQFLAPTKIRRTIHSPDTSYQGLPAPPPLPFLVRTTLLRRALSFNSFSLLSSSDLSALDPRKP